MIENTPEDGLQNDSQIVNEQQTDASSVESHNIKFDEEYDLLINQFQKLCDNHKINTSIMIIGTPDKGALTYANGELLQQASLLRDVLHEYRKRISSLIT